METSNIVQQEKKELSEAEASTNGENSEVSAVGEANVEEPEGKKASAKKRKKKLPIIIGVIVIVLVCAFAGFWVWHEQPSFCNAICHTPMDPYNITYNQASGQPGIDKWGNEVSDAGSMLCVSHKEANDITCLDCHVPTLSEQINEGMEWLSNNYPLVDNPTYGGVLVETTLEDLTQARGISGESFCLNDACHNKKDVVRATGKEAYNPHEMVHTQYTCSECHKAHRASMNQCSACHSEAPLPNGWIRPAEEKILAATAKAETK